MSPSASDSATPSEEGCVSQGAEINCLVSPGALVTVCRGGAVAARISEGSLAAPRVRRSSDIQWWPWLLNRHDGTLIICQCWFAMSVVVVGAPGAGLIRRSVSV